MTVISIFGSCVSRDAFAMSPVQGLSVGTYIARSSLASAGHDVASGWGQLDAIESAFQRRMVSMDLAKDGFAQLAADGAPVVLLDLIDERFDLVLMGGSVATRSNEFLRMGLDEAAFEHRWKLGDEARRKMWRYGARKLVDQLAGKRIILNRAFWACNLSDDTVAAAGKHPCGQPDVGRHV